MVLLGEKTRNVYIHDQLSVLFIEDKMSKIHLQVYEHFQRRLNMYWSYGIY